MYFPERLVIRQNQRAAQRYCTNLEISWRKKIVDCILKMQDLGHPLTPMQLRLKVAVATEGRSMPWSGSGIPTKRWLRCFRHRHPQLVNRHSQGLEVARACALNPTTAETLYANLEFLYSSYKYPLAHI